MNYKIQTDIILLFNQWQLYRYYINIIMILWYVANVLVIFNTRILTMFAKKKYNIQEVNTWGDFIMALSFLNRVYFLVIQKKLPVK